MITIREVRERLRRGEPKYGNQVTLAQMSGDVPGSLGGIVTYSGLPRETFARMRLEHWQQRPGKGLEEALQAAVAMIRGGDGFCLLTLAGPPGCGKTHLAIAIGWTWLLAGARVFYRQSEGLLDELRRTFDLSHSQTADMYEPTFDQILERFKSCHLLIIDDLGVEKPTEWALARLDSIIDHRWLRQLPTVVTTNLKAVDLPPRIVDRLKDTECGKVIQIGAPSYRSWAGAKPRLIPEEEEELEECRK